MCHGLRSGRGGFGSFRAVLFFGYLLSPIFVSPCVQAQTPALPPLRPVPIQLSVVTPPVIFRGNGQHHFAYEIQMTNWSTDVWTVQRIEVSSAGGASLLAVDGSGLGNLLWHPARKADDQGAEVGTLAPGESVLAYMWVDLAQGASLPSAIRNRFTVKQAGDERLRELDVSTAVVSRSLPVIAPPLRGTNWLAANGPSGSSAHRRARAVIEGVPYISQRYAIDWLKVEENPETHHLQTHHGDPKDNRNYVCFGADALSVADAVVVEVKDGIPENVPHEPPVVPITLETIAGNHVLLDLGRGVYAMYAHLQPGSLRVKVGDKVKRGQVLGLVGNTGNSDEPHLHFQLMNRASPLGAEGLPYALSAFGVTQRISGDWDDPTATPLAAPVFHRGEIPMDMQLVNFE